jgi:outer membrane immunogenic protein
MRKVVFVALSTVAISAFPGGGGAVRAADLDWRYDRNYRDGSLKDDPVMVPRYAFSWTGFYLGGNLGYAWGDTETVGDFDGLGDGFVIHPSGWTVGLQGGFNWQVGANVVAGFEVDLGILDASDDQSNGATFIETEYGAYGTFTGRLGWAQDRWLFYLKGGLAIADIDNTAGAVADPASVTREDDVRMGWALGGGAEYAFHPNWSMKIEYMYMDFGEDLSTAPAGDVYQHENEISAIRVGVNYRFQPVDIPLR